MGYVEARSYDAKFGQITEVIDANGVKSCRTYDEFGRKVTETLRCGTPDEVTEKKEFNFTESGVESNGSVFVLTEHTEDANGNNIVEPHNIYFDAREREIRREHYGFDGKSVLIDSGYDPLLRKVRVSKPYYSGGTIHWTHTHYDAIDRIYQVDYPAGDLDGDGIAEAAYSETFNYSGYTSTTIDAKGRHKTEEKDALGRIVTVIEDSTALAVSTRYQYDSRGNLIDVESDDGNHLQTTYDRLGRKISTVDPNMGEWTYTYNSLGELITQTDALQQTTTNSYDLMGRIVTRSDADGTSSWIYDSGIGAIGQVVSESGPDGTSKTFTYDAYSRVVKTTTHMGSSNGNNESFVVLKSYDLLGRQSSVIYPDVSGSSAAVNYHYNQYGFLQYLTDAEGGVIWVARSANAQGQLTEDEYQNGAENTYSYNVATGWLKQTQSTSRDSKLIQFNQYNYDELGNVLERYQHYLAQDTLGLSAGAEVQLAETFVYDDLDRLTGAQLDNYYTGYSQNSNYAYSRTGNLLSKTDVGSYSYGGSCSGVTAGPNAVTKVGSSNYCYDRNGNMISGNGRSVIYTAFNKPERITSNTGGSVDFYHGANRSRLIKRSQLSGTTKTTYYVGLGGSGGTLYEKSIDANGQVSHLLFIYAGNYHRGQPFAQIQLNDSGVQEGIDFFHRDHIGSVTAVTDETGLFWRDGLTLGVETRSYDPWGKLRSVNGELDPLAQNIEYPGNLNFTGHENIPEVGLIHMNGRIYDPVLGKMLSADPTVPEPLASIGYNRYAYVNNNPLKYNDPTGYSPNDAPDIEEISVEGRQDTGGNMSYGSMSVFFGGASSDLMQLSTTLSVNILASYTTNALNQAKAKAKAGKHRRGLSGEWGLVYQAPQRSVNSTGKFANGKAQKVAVCPVPMACAGQSEGGNKSYERSPRYQASVEYAKDFTATVIGVIGDAKLQPPGGTSLGLPVSLSVEVAYQAGSGNYNSANTFGIFLGGSAASLSTIFSANPLVGIAVGNTVSQGASKLYDSSLRPQTTKEFWRNYKSPQN